MKRAALYIRVSTDAQFEEGYSVEAQKEMLEGWCKSRGIRHYEFYVDGGFTGSNIDRPEMQRLIADVREGSISHVAVYKLDRLSRSQKDTLYLIEDVFNPAGVDFTSLGENLDTGTPMGRAMLGILSAFAQLERETIRERTRMGMLERVKSGYWMGGGRVPFGYDYDRSEGILMPNGDAETVRRVFSLYQAGLSAERIAVLTGLKHDKQVRDILHRQAYTGAIPFRGQVYPGRHQPIISREEFDRVQRLLAERSDRRLLSSGQLLTGLVWCGRCGARMRYQKWGKAGYKLTCYSQQRSKPCLVHDPDCDNPKAWADEVEQAVLSDLFSRSLDDAESGEGESPAVSPAGALAAQQEQAARRLKRLYALYAAAEDDLLLQSIQEQRAALQRVTQALEQAKREEAHAQAQESRKAQIRELSDAWPLMTLSERRAVLRELIDRIEIDGSSLHIAYRQ